MSPGRIRGHIFNDDPRWVAIPSIRKGCLRLVMQLAISRATALIQLPTRVLLSKLTLLQRIIRERFVCLFHIWSSNSCNLRRSAAHHGTRSLASKAMASSAFVTYSLPHNSASIFINIKTDHNFYVLDGWKLIVSWIESLPIIKFKLNGCGRILSSLGLTNAFELFCLIRNRCGWTCPHKLMWISSDTVVDN